MKSIAENQAGHFRKISLREYNALREEYNRLAAPYFKKLSLLYSTQSHMICILENLSVKFTTVLTEEGERYRIVYESQLKELYLSIFQFIKIDRSLDNENYNGENYA